MDLLKKEGKYIAIALLLLLGFLGLYMVNSYTSFVTYPRQGFIEGGITSGFLPGFGGLLDLYYEYSQWFDFLIFLCIFLGLASTVFGKHFKEGSKAVYVGLGIFLSLALVLWEARTGIYLIEFFGPLVLVFLVILVFFILYKFLAGNVSRRGALVICGLYIAFYVACIMFNAGSFVEWYYGSWFYFNIPIDLIPIATVILWLIAIPGLIVSAFIKGK